MPLDIRPPFPVMEARSVDRLPRGAEWQYEPKWDGFRCLLIRTGDRLRMQSKSGRDLSRYFPEVAVAAMSLADTQFTLDGELVIPVGDRFSFDDLLQRIHPAASRIKRLAAETPAVFLAFDLLRCGRDDMDGLPLMKRRPALERFAKRHFKHSVVFRLSPQVGIPPMPNGGSPRPAAAATASSPSASIFPTKVAIARACKRSSACVPQTA